MEKIVEILWSAEENRLRAGARVLVQLAIWFALTVMLSIPAAVILLLFPESFYTLNVALNALTFIPSVLLARRFLDRRSVTSLGLAFNRPALRDVLVGIGIAALMMGLIYLLEVGAGWLTFTGFAWESADWFENLGGMAWWGLLFLFVGFYEELFSRGYQLQNLEEGFNLFWAVVLSSGFFGWLHILNPGSTWVSTLGVAAAGVFFAFVYLRTRQLWLPIGIHIGWNFFEGPVFGFQVSGMETPRMLQHVIDGPEIWTGGAFGPEAGLILLPGLVLGVILVSAYTRGRLASSTAGEKNG